MGVYLGYIEKKGSEPTVFYNYKPIYEIRENLLIPLSPDDQIDLLPDSDKRDINFSYNFNNVEHCEFMESLFAEKSLVLFEFELGDLQDNVNSRGDRNQTGYKVSAQSMVENGKIQNIDNAGLYRLIRKNETRSDFFKDSIVEIDAIGLVPGSKILVELEGSLYAGPYIVGHREIDKTFYVRPQIKENKYTILGYKKSDCTVHEVLSPDSYWGNPETNWYIAIPGKEAEKEYQDVISDADLLESFKESIANESIGNGYINVSNIENLLSNYENSILTGKSITKAIRTKRLNKLVEILTSEAELDDVLSLITESLCDLIVKYKDAPNVDELINSIVEKRPDFIDRMQGSRIIKEEIAKLGHELDELQQEKFLLEEDIEKKREASQTVEQAAIEEKTKILLAIDEQYSLKKAELDAMLKDLSLAEEVGSLNKKHVELKREIDYIQTHKGHLENDSKNLETEFLARINNYHDRMVGIAFDGFMSNKMLKAAAQWEAEETECSYAEAVEAINAVDGVDMAPEYLIEYLCKTVQVTRPQYSRNTIINIAICISQGFLTVFSGEPGCGKTSICNIIAEVLGLNKIEKTIPNLGEHIDSFARYIPVAVERGWTSKRDFIGYFNPLSKTFDRSNRRIYDALKLLDIEQKEDIAKYPFYILLDEANLSPMEYYWADFMNICDDLDSNCKINLGESSIFSIPETLHFVATINNDHTTETLSPRLIDRAWIITLPQVASIMVGAKIPQEQIEIITWQSIKAAFIPESDSALVMSPEAQKVYDSILIPHFRKARIIVSPRTDLAIKRYWIVASKRLEKDEYGNDSSIVALDYAVAQKMLPKITGNGDNYAKWLEDLRDICSSNNLSISARLVKEILDRGNTQMKYYQFFG